MRVWILEDQPDYESTTRLGVFTSPHGAWDAMFTRLDDHVFALPSFELHAVQVCRQPEDDVTLDVVHYSNDRVRLVGAYVKGTGDPALTVTEGREFQEVAALISQHARKIESFERTEVIQWDVRRTTDPTAVWRFVKKDD